MATKRLTLDDVTWTLTAEVDSTPVHGNASATGDEDADRKYEDYILRRLDRGDEWAWACVTVRP